MSRKPTLAIVSSASDRCGIAIYAEALARQLRHDLDVKIIPLDLFCLRSDDTRLGDRHLSQIAAQLPPFDYVNIQFEFGIYGNSARTVCRRVRRLIRAARTVSITFHSLEVPRRLCSGAHARQLMMGQLRRLSQSLEGRSRGKCCWELARLLKERQGSGIVHTRRDKKILSAYFPGLNTVAHPLVYGYETPEDASREQLRRDFFAKFQLDPVTRVVGVFGFLSKYKGHLTAIEALRELPEQFRLFVFGSQHPASIKPFRAIDPYLKKLIQVIKQYGLDKRVTFVEGGTDRDFYQAMKCCDAVVLPYLEVGQSASGIAALALESRSFCVCSGSSPFRELAKFTQIAYPSFSIGNFMELGQILSRGKPDEFDALNESYHRQFNVQTNCRAYLDAMGVGTEVARTDACAQEGARAA